MNLYFNILQSESNLRDYLGRLKEYNEFDKYVQFFIEDCQKKRIIHLPSKGRSGEQGKDIVSIENEEDLSYCAYVIKCGNLDKNLYGPYGIIKQMSDAMLLDLKEQIYHKKKRMVVVVYNGYEGNRAAITHFDDEKRQIEIEAEKLGLLLKNIERWDLPIFAKMLFPFRQYIIEKDFFTNTIDMMRDTVYIVQEIAGNIFHLIKNIEAPSNDTEQFVCDLNERLIKLTDKYGPFQPINREEGHNE